jgi:hypothetical protein
MVWFASALLALSLLPSNNANLAANSRSSDEPTNPAEALIPSTESSQNADSEPKPIRTYLVKIGGATLQVDFAPGALDLPPEALLNHIRAAADAVATYFGRFPVNRARVLVVPTTDGHGGIEGTTWGNAGGFPAFTRLRVDQHTTASDLADDWVTTHELTHMAFPSLPHFQHWMEEGMATYIEPIARVQTGELQSIQIWSDMVHGIPQGEPRPGDQGLDHTHSWGRTYWGGGLFCLMADIEIHRQTGNRMGLQDAMRAIVAAGGAIDQEWQLEKALEIGDQASGTRVLTSQYAAWKNAPVTVDLPGLWQELGIRSKSGGGIEFVPSAHLAAVREAITANRKPGPAPPRAGAPGKPSGY